jgi:hypothetical protein
MSESRTVGSVFWRLHSRGGWFPHVVERETRTRLYWGKLYIEKADLTKLLGGFKGPELVLWSEAEVRQHRTNGLWRSHRPKLARLVDALHDVEKLRAVAVLLDYVVDESKTEEAS